MFSPIFTPIFLALAMKNLDYPTFMTWIVDTVLEKIKAKLRERNQASLELHLIYHRAVIETLRTIYEAQYPVMDLCGMGGAGCVLLLSTDVQNGIAHPIKKCLKYHLPLIGQSTTLNLASVLDNEAKRLTEIHHQNIVPLESVSQIDLSSAKDIDKQNQKVPYYLMPFIDGVDLAKYMLSDQASPDALCSLLSQAAAALDYVHARGYVHLDIKPQNVFVQSSNTHEPIALLADFGYCKKVQMDSTGLTLVVGTDGYIHPELQALMKHPTTTHPDRVRDDVERNKLSTHFDYFSFGATILDSIASYLRKEGHTFPVSTLRGLLFVALRCSDGYPDYYGHDQTRAILASPKFFKPAMAKAFRYSSTSDLAHNLKILASSLKEYTLLEEISGASGGILRIPPRTFAPFTKRVEETVDAAPVRRLANVSQLALCSHIYPGATNTRKEHSLGTFAQTARMARHILLDPQCPLAPLILSEKQQKLLLLGALLHDMAHVPLLHELEDALPELSQERYFTEILQRKWGDASFQSDIDNIVKLWGVSRSELSALLGEIVDKPPDEMSIEEWREMSARPEHQLVRSLLDAGIDVDKMDYLQRDALHAGVEYGHAIDVDRLERTMTAAIWAQGSNTNWLVKSAFGVWARGQAAAEAVIASRRNMYTQVYAHRTVRAARAMLNYVAWTWQTSKVYNGYSAVDLANRFFAYASMLPARHNQQLLQPQEPTVKVEPEVTDNLAFSDTRVIRWLALVSESASAIKVAKALIQRKLYKQICEVGEQEATKFLKMAYPLVPKSRWQRQQTALSAEQWLALTDFMCARVNEFLAQRQGSLSRPIIPNVPEMPEVLVDVAIPKTMRTQKELVVITDALGSKISWRRLEQRSHTDQEGCPLGLSVEPSPIYEIYGGNESESLSPLLVRLFARWDIAESLRHHLEPSDFLGWLNSWRKNS